MTVYGPQGIDSFIKTSLQVSGTHLKYPLEIIEIEEGTVFEDEQFKVTAMSLDHGIYSIGYRVVEKDRPGSLLVDRLRSEGVKPGPLFKALKNGQTVCLDDGRVINGKDYISAPKKAGSSRFLVIQECAAMRSFLLNRRITLFMKLHFQRKNLKWHQPIIIRPPFRLQKRL